MTKRNPGNEPIEVHCRYFLWRLSSRNGVWQADGRRNSTNAGRHSLGRGDLDQAMRTVHDLSVRVAVDVGVADQRQLQKAGRTMLEISTGNALFVDHIRRPAFAAGPNESTRRRYERILRTLQKFTIEYDIEYWEQVDGSVLNHFLKSRSNDCSHARIVTEVSLIKWLHAFLIAERHLNADCAFRYEVVRAKSCCGGTVFWCREPILSVFFSFRSLLCQTGANRRTI